MKTLDIVGSVHKTNKYGNLIVTKYINNVTVHIRFINTGYETVVTLHNVKNGSVKDRFSPSVYGVGIIGDCVGMVNKKHTLEYHLWQSALERCYSEKFQQKRPTYKGCTFSDNFKQYPYFKEWCNKQVGFNSKDDKGKPFHLDKDILVKGNKLYSEDTCCFVPNEINNLFTNFSNNKREYPRGVFYNEGNSKFCSQLSKQNRITKLGYFMCEIEAFQAYKQAKESYIKEVAEKWRDKIDVRVYEALMKYEVEITD